MNTIATAIALDKWVESRHYQRDRLALAQARDHSNSKHRGAQYVLPEDHAEFLKRAAAGEFSIQPKTPHPPRAKHNS